MSDSRDNTDFAKTARIIDTLIMQLQSKIGSMRENDNRPKIFNDVLENVPTLNNFLKPDAPIQNKINIFHTIVKKIDEAIEKEYPDGLAQEGTFKGKAADIAAGISSSLFKTKPKIRLRSILCDYYKYNETIQNTLKNYPAPTSGDDTKKIIIKK